MRSAAIGDYLVALHITAEALATDVDASPCERSMALKAKRRLLGRSKKPAMILVAPPPNRGEGHLSRVPILIVAAELVCRYFWAPALFSAMMRITRHLN